MVFGASTAYAAPKIKNYLDVKKAFNTAKGLQAAGDYVDALNALNNVNNKWMPESTRKDLQALETQESNLFKIKVIMILLF